MANITCPQTFSEKISYEWACLLLKFLVVIKLKDSKVQVKEKRLYVVACGLTLVTECVTHNDKWEMNCSKCSLPN